MIDRYSHVKGRAVFFIDSPIFGHLVVMQQQKAEMRQSARCMTGKRENFADFNVLQIPGNASSLVGHGRADI